MRLFLLIITTVSLFVGCAYSKDDTIQDKAQLRQNDLIDSTYGPLVGTYAGTLTTPRSVEDVRMIIYIESDSINNADGTPGTKRVPKAHFSRDFPVVEDYFLDVRNFTKENGSLHFVNPGTIQPGGSTPTVGLDQIRSIDVIVSGNNITGQANTSAGRLGDLKLSLSSRQTDEPDNGVSEDRRNRLIRLYQSLAGEYVGAITSGKKTIPISIALTVFTTADSLPSFTGYYKRLDIPSGVVDLSMKVEYNPDTSPPRITMDGQGARFYHVSLNGTLKDDKIVGDFSSAYEGFTGKVTLKKKKQSP